MSETKQQEIRRLEREILELEIAALEKQKRDEIGAGDAAVTGFTDSASLGFVDELAGGLEAAGSMVGLRGLGSSSLGDIRFETDEEDEQSLSDIYSQARDARRQRSDDALSAQPFATAAGNVGGAVATGALAGPLAGGASRFSTAMGGAALPTGLTAQAGAIGGLSGAGLSESDSVLGLAADSAMGAGFGVGSGLLGSAVLKGVEKMGGLAKQALGGAFGRGAQRKAQKQGAKIMEDAIEQTENKVRSRFNQMKREMNMFRESVELEEEIAKKAAKQVSTADMNADGVIGDATSGFSTDDIFSFGKDALTGRGRNMFKYVPSVRLFTDGPKATANLAPNLFVSEGE